MTERLRVREIVDDEGAAPVRIVRRGADSVVTWRRAQMVLLSAQGMEVAGDRPIADYLSRVRCGPDTLRRPRSSGPCCAAYRRWRGPGGRTQRYRDAWRELAG
ncbi:MAG TPA: hypothetical protein VMK13_08195 [Streptosporangiaceae bacterium]|nr:hypothetical protein [Streptosporangiaceae bacterium]